MLNFQLSEFHSKQFNHFKLPNYKIQVTYIHMMLPQYFFPKIQPAAICQIYLGLKIRPKHSEGKAWGAQIKAISELSTLENPSRHSLSMNFNFFWMFCSFGSLWLIERGDNSRLAVSHGWYNISLCIIIRELAQVPAIPTYCNAETGLEFTFFLTLQFWWH